MQHIVFDLEWNQAVIREKIIQSPVFLHGEIVQIGAVKLDADFQELDQLKLDVKPAYYTRMNSRVRRLTGISNQMLKQGLSFPEALEQFRLWCGAEGPYDFITWGTDDMPILRENLQLYEQELDWLPTCYDLQRIYDQQVAHGNRQWALSAALEKLEISPIGQAHDALNDAVNTVQVCKALDMERGLLEYTEPERREKRAAPGPSLLLPGLRNAPRPHPVDPPGGGPVHGHGGLRGAWGIRAQAADPGGGGRDLYPYPHPAHHGRRRPGPDGKIRQPPQKAPAQAGQGRRRSARRRGIRPWQRRRLERWNPAPAF